MRKVYLHGILRDPDHPGPYEIVAASIADAIKLLSMQLPRLKPDINGRKRIKVVGVEREVDLHSTRNQDADIHVTPQFCGGKGSAGGIIQSVLGAVLIALSFAIAAPFAGIALSLGATLLIGGVLQLINAPDTKSVESNVYLGAPQNTVAIGTPIPVLCGRRVIGGQFITYAISAGLKIADYPGAGLS